MRRHVALLVCGLAIASSGLCAQDVTDVVFLSNEEYLPVLLESIGDARSSIRVEMYLIRPGPSEGHPVTKILAALTAARKRGVRVEVLLDRHFASDNEKAAERLRSSGIEDVRWESEEVTNHTKAVVIDEETLIVGSQNWTLAALAASTESAVVVRSRAVVEELRQREKERRGVASEGAR